MANGHGGARVGAGHKTQIVTDAPLITLSSILQRERKKRLTWLTLLS